MDTLTPLQSQEEGEGDKPLVEGDPLKEKVDQVLEMVGLLGQFYLEMETQKGQRQTVVILLTLIMLCLIWIRYGHAALMGAKVAAVKTQESAHEIRNWWARVHETPGDGKRPEWGVPWNREAAIGEWLNGEYRVTSDYGPRRQPAPGASTYHLGTDVGMPVGTKIYAIGEPGSKVKIECKWNTQWKWIAESYVPEWDMTFRYLHGSKCASGEFAPGTVFMESGDAGSGPHLHFEQYNGQRGKVGATPPEAGFVFFAIYGREPKSGDSLIRK